MAVPVQQPRRTDWRIQYTCLPPKPKEPRRKKNTNAEATPAAGNERAEEEEEGEDGTNVPLDLRIEGLVRALDNHTLEVLALSKFVKLPEEWTRGDRLNQQTLKLVRLAAVMVLQLLFVVAMGVAIYTWSQGNPFVSSAVVSRYTGVYTVLKIVDTLNGFYVNSYTLSTSKTIQTQLFTLLGKLMVGCALSGSAIGLSAALMHALPFRVRQTAGRPSRSFRFYAVTFGLALKAAEYGLCHERLFGTQRLLQADASAMRAVVPAVAVVSRELMTFGVVVIIYMLGQALLLYMDGSLNDTRMSLQQNSSTTMPYLSNVLMSLALGGIMAGSLDVSPLSGLGHFAALAALYSLIILIGNCTCFRFHSSVVPLSAAAYTTTAVLAGAITHYIDASRQGSLASVADIARQPVGLLLCGYLSAFCLVWSVAISLSKHLAPVTDDYLNKMAASGGASSGSYLSANKAK